MLNGPSFAHSSPCAALTRSSKKHRTIQNLHNDGHFGHVSWFCDAENADGHLSDRLSCTEHDVLFQGSSRDVGS